MSTVAGLPQFVVLKSKSDGKYLHSLLNDPSLGPYINYIGCKRNLDPVDPFVKFEVVPSSSDPTQLVHLRCSHNNKFLQLHCFWVSATADRANERTTLFLPIFPAGEPNTVGFRHVQTNCHMQIFNQGFNKNIHDVACVLSNDRVGMQRFEFAAWESYDEKIRKAKDDERKRMEASFEEKMKGKDDERKRLEASYVEKIKAKDEEIKELRSKAKDSGRNGGDDFQQVDAIIAELRWEIAELKVLLDDACRENDDLKEAAGK